jgi:hypothetical protein
MSLPTQSSFVWSQGKVEDNNDPLAIGRCRVRWLGIHSQDKKEIPTNHLPWALPIHPLNTRALFSTPNIGDWVIGFFMDGEACQEPIMFGIVPSKSSVNQSKTYAHDDQANQFVTNSGHKIDLNDGTNEITITHNNNDSKVVIHEDGKFTIKNKETNINEPFAKMVSIINNIITATNWTGNMGAPLIYSKQPTDVKDLIKAEEALIDLFKDFESFQ